ncbi:dTMP kinase [Bacillus luteus]|uniref:Thymidylate kinase n=1 Tax=Alkalicoccus luteus TaxID=1237094 RepID=A0A969PWY9_9BACI|nr:dTMP kinase [Alkalicoccus luteus]NJP39004.1 dTMP kinase [Alkalicoccus luteus]
MNSVSGWFITVEGGEGAGKTTAMLSLKEKLEGEGWEVLATREPGGSVIAEKIRAVILDPSHTEMDPRTEALLYAAARRQHLIEKVFPHLEKGGIVLCDRFVDSSLVYQGYARGIGVEAVKELNRFATEGRMPDLTLYFDIDPEIGLARISSGRGHEVNRLDAEALPFHEKVRSMYRELQQQEPERIRQIDASGTPDLTVKKAWEEIHKKLAGR